MSQTAAQQADLRGLGLGLTHVEGSSVSLIASIALSPALIVVRNILTEVRARIGQSYSKITPLTLKTEMFVRDVVDMRGGAEGNNFACVRRTLSTFGSTTSGP